MIRLISVVILLLISFFPEGLDAHGQKQLDRALSLKVLQERLRICVRSGKCSNDLLKLCGLTKIEGYVLDDASNDLILFGQADPRLPSLYTEDFVIALRNACLKYSELRGNTYYYSNPGCSIDPDPNVMRQLENLAKKIPSNSSSGEITKKMEQWGRICEKPQTVRVFGIPFTTHFAKIMVDADYYMKRLVDGSVSLEIDGFTSLVDMTLNKAKKDILDNQPISIPASSMNRFWFYPGGNEYKYGRGIVRIDKCPVILLTEAQYLSKNNKILGKGKSNALAQQFAEDFSILYSKIAREKPIYSELEGLFRLVALAKIIKYKGLKKKVDLNYLLNQFQVSQIKINPSLPGIPNVNNFEQLWIPSCGGVGIEIEVRAKKFVKEQKDGLAAKLREVILKLRPSLKALFWDYSLEPKALASVYYAPPPAARDASSPMKRTKEKIEKGRSKDIDPIIRERIMDDIEASRNAKDIVILDLFRDKRGTTYLNIVDSKGNREETESNYANDVGRLLNMTANTKGKFGRRILEGWNKVYHEYLATSANPRRCRLPNGREIILKPLLIIKSNEVNHKYANLEKVPILRDSFVTFIASKQQETRDVAETTAEELTRKIKDIPRLSQENVFFAIRPPRRGVKMEMQKKWKETIIRLEQVVGIENVLFNPSKDEFTKMLSNRKKEIIVIEVTHTTEGITLKGNETYTSMDILKGGDLSHIKYLIAGNSCSLPQLQKGELAAAFRKKGVGIMNTSYGKVSMETVLKRLRELIRILESVDEYDLPAYYVPDIIDQLIDVPKNEKRSIHQGKLDFHKGLFLS